MRAYLGVMLLLAIDLGGCGGLPAEITKTRTMTAEPRPQEGALAGAPVAVLPFQGPMGSAAREAALRVAPTWLGAPILRGDVDRSSALRACPRRSGTPDSSR